MSSVYLYAGCTEVLSRLKSWKDMDWSPGRMWTDGLLQRTLEGHGPMDCYSGHWKHVK